ncbi:MAG: exodeoxyribonuclease III [Planctomycetes bacterium]|nr:exodeoxyribonuclease III [Planctomycetota bacterium]
MRIATFNCNSIRIRAEAVLAWLAEYQPDILALQETKVMDKDFPADCFREAGWHVAFRGEKSYNGVAVITRSAPDEVSFGLRDDEGASDTRLVRVRIGDFHLINTYVPQGQSLLSEKFQFKLEWFSRLRRYLDNGFNATDKILWVGDLNVAPLPIDVYDSKAIWPHVCHSQPVIDAFASVTGFGFHDIFRKHLPDAGNFTFWDYRQRGSLDRNRGWRIDHILATAPLEKTSQSCAVDIEPRKRDRPSDHTFVYADFAV